jgi:hypothetical protein
MTTQDLRITDMRMDGGTQPRAQLDMVTLLEYTEAMQNGATFPPVRVLQPVPRPADGCGWRVMVMARQSRNSSGF